MPIPDAPTRVIILHGAHGGPDTNWFPDLHQQLEARGLEVLRPRFPTPEGQSLAAWLEVHDRAVAGLPPAAEILVGHSLGAAFALRLAERRDRPLAGLFLVAGFLGALGLPDYDPINASFFETAPDWTHLRDMKGPAAHCWAADNDPYVPLERSQELARQLDSPLTLVPGGGHLGSEYREFPQVRDAVLAAAETRPV
ncbi:MAG: alpha/beta fold hydrolase [Rhodobacteraceae bacterium]|nr:alpha/beta fold hydrolase [Paracoccaceae bacterium]MBR9822818.1 alpha/beta fold hydrolase [Paracoccaceae bacterium]